MPRGYKKAWNDTKAFLPIPNIMDPYTYLKDLTAKPTEGRSMAIAIGNYAQGVLQMGANPGGKYEDQKWNNQAAYTFMTGRANALRAGEEAFIENKLKALEKSGMKGEAYENLKRIFEERNSNGGANYYEKLIAAINLINIDINQLKARLAAIGNKEDDHRRNLERNLMGQVSSLISNYSNSRAQFAYSMEEMTRLLTMEYMQKYGRTFIEQQIKNNITNGAEKTAAVEILISRQIGQYLNDNKRELLKKQNDFYDEKEFKSLFNTLSNELDQIINPETRNRIFSDDELLNDMIRMFGIKVDLSKGYTIRNYKVSVDEHGKMYGKTARNALTKILKELEISKEISSDKTFNQAFKHITVNYTADRAVSRQDELQSAVIQALNGHKHLGRLNGGTDLISIVFPSIDPTDEDGKKIAQSLLNELEQTIHDQKATNDPEKISKIYTDFLNKLEQQMGEIKKGFVLHETNKLYTTLEGHTFHDKRGFHGRSVNIINYIDMIAQFGVSMGIDVNWLKFLAYNLPEASYGSNNKSSLEFVFATAAGIIMFDDFQQIAITSIEDVSSSSVTNIHLYKLNDVYVPASYFLTQVATTLQHEIFSIQPEDMFQAEITSIPSITYQRPGPNDPKTSPEDWAAIKESSGNAIVKTYFAANFLRLIESVLNSIQ